MINSELCMVAAIASCGYFMKDERSKMKCETCPNEFVPVRTGQAGMNRQL